MRDGWPPSVITRAPIAAYVTLAYLITWGFGLPLLAARRGWVSLDLSEGWEIAAAFGPLAAALIVCWTLARREGVRRLLRGLVRWRVGTAWILFSVLSPVALLAMAAVIVRLSSGAWPDPGAFNVGKLATAAGLLHLVVVSGLVQGLGEEPGWRGFMLPRLRQRFSALNATLALFPVWLFWHLPAFLGRPEFGLAQWLAFSMGVLSAAIWLTFIWEHTASSLMAVTWHAMINISRGVALAISTPMFLAMSTLVLAGAILIAGYWLLSRDKGGSARHPGV